MRKICLLVVMALITAFSASAQKTWSGASGGDWANPANWTPAGVPAAADNVIFSGFTGTVIFNANVTDLASIAITNSSTVTFQSFSSTPYTIGGTTAPVFTIDGTSTLQQKTGGTVAAGGIIINVSGASSIAVGGTLRQLSGTSSRITVTAGTFTINGSIYCQSEEVAVGVFSNAAFITVTAGNLSFGPGAYAELNRTGGMPSMPYAFWDATSTLKVTGITGTTVGVHTWTNGATTPHKLGNFIFDCPNLGPTSFSLVLNNSSALLVDEFKGDVQILNSNGKIVSFSSTNAVNQTITFRGNLTIGAGVSDFRPMNSASANTGVVTWNCEKNVSIAAGTMGMNANSSTAHSINLTGTTNQNLGLPVFTSNGIFSVNVNNGGNGATLTSNTGNLKNIILTNGKLSLGNFNVVAGYNAGTVSGSSSNYIITNGTGKLTTVNTPAATNTLFPLGISTASYDPVRINPANTADFTVGVRDASTGFSNPEANAALTCNREWNISTAGTPGSTLVEFEPDATTGGCPGAGTKVVGHYTGGVWTETASAAGPNFPYSATFSSFSPFGVGVTGGFACSPANAGTVSGTSPLYPGATATYTSNGDPGGSWSSTNTATATVDPVTGLVTALAVGTTDITYTVTNACGPVSSFKTLTVTNTNTWTGASGSDWATASNWSLGIVPTATQDVVFNGFSGTVKFLSVNTVAPCASITVTNAADVTFEDQDNGADSVGTALSPTLLTINGNSALRSRTIGSNSLTGGVVINTTGSSVIAAGSTFDMKSGTFNKIIMRGGTLDVNGTILCGNEVLSGGTSNSGFINRIAGTLNFGPGSLVEFNRTSGISSGMPLANWDATSTIRVINCTGASGLTGWSAGTHSLGNVVIDASGMNIPVYNLGFSSATALLVNEIKGDFTVLNANGKIITLSAITAANNTQAQTINFRGNVTVNNTAEFRAFNYTGAGTGSGTATWNFEKNVTLPLVGVSINSGTAHTMNFTGAVPQTLNLGGFATNGIFSLTINNGGNGVTLNANTGNLKNITLTNGNLSLGNYNAVAGYNAGSVTGNSGTGWVVTNGSGTLTIAGVPSVTGKNFPVGISSTSYDPVGIVPATAADFTIGLRDASAGFANPENDPALTCNREWNITTSGTPGNTQVEFEPGSTNGCPGAGTKVVGHYTGSQWTETNSTTGSVFGYTYSASFSTFSPFGAGVQTGFVSSTLPSDLISFSGEKQGANNRLKWTTASESNNRGFEVLRSTDGINYTVIGFVNSLGSGGNSNSELNYSFTDFNVTSKKNYYRLRQVDMDNRSKLSNIILIKSDTKLALAIDGLSPNPATAVLNVLLNAPAREIVVLVVTDLTGRVMKQQIANTESGSNTIAVDLVKLSRGYYFIKVLSVTTGETTTAKFIKQ